VKALSALYDFCIMRVIVRVFLLTSLCSEHMHGTVESLMWRIFWILLRFIGPITRPDLLGPKLIIIVEVYSVVPLRLKDVTVVIINKVAVLANSSLSFV